MGILVFSRFAGSYNIYKSDKNKPRVVFRVILEFFDLLIFYEMFKAFKKGEKERTAAIHQISALNTYCIDC